MPSTRRVVNAKTKRRIRFPKPTSDMASQADEDVKEDSIPNNTAAASSILELLLNNGKGSETGTQSRQSSSLGAQNQLRPDIDEELHTGMKPSLTPSMHLSLPFIMDELDTETSGKQRATARNIMKYLNENPLPNLERTSHIQFLIEPLEYGLPKGFTTLDASRPWLLYWCINALTILGEDVGIYHDQMVSTLKPLQSKTGGLGGGNGQIPHVAATYAGLLALTITAYHASRFLPEEERLALYAASFSWIDRKSLLQWIRRIKLQNGGFKVHEEGEEDVRAGYCALVVAAIMGYDDDELQGDPDEGESHLLEGVAEYFQSCQTWEGGLAAKANSEAHGGYAFCILGALCLLGDPKEILSEHLDLPGLISWLSARQYAPEGGLSGRTNKLVDGCYSTWVGGCWAFVEAALNGMASSKSGLDLHFGSLWSRKALIRYILTCCQDARGGLRDKPRLRPDHYHTNYVLLGLSAAQHYYFYDPSELTSQDLERSPFKHGFCWKGSRNVPRPSTKEGFGGGWEEGLVPIEGDRVEMQHPIFNIPLGAEMQIQKWWSWLNNSD